MFPGLKSLKGRFSLRCVPPCLASSLEIPCMFLCLLHSLSQLFPFDLLIAFCSLILTFFLFSFAMSKFHINNLLISFFCFFLPQVQWKCSLTLFSYVIIKGDPCNTQKTLHTYCTKPKLKVGKWVIICCVYPDFVCEKKLCQQPRMLKTYPVTIWLYWKWNRFLFVVHESKQLSEQAGGQRIMQSGRLALVTTPASAGRPDVRPPHPLHIGHGLLQYRPPDNHFSKLSSHASHLRNNWTNTDISGVITEFCARESMAVYGTIFKGEALLDWDR